MLQRPCIRVTAAVVLTTLLAAPAPAQIAGTTGLCEESTERELVPILTSCVDADATGYGTFQSHNQKVVSNAHGVFLTHIRRRNEAYDAQQWRLSRSRDGGQTFDTVFEATHATNPPALETDRDGNLYLVRPDWSDGHSYLYRFSPRDGYATPSVSAIPGTSHGKFAMELDEPRGRLYYFSANNTFSVMNLDGKVTSSIQLLSPGPHAALQYPLLHLDRDGTLYAAWTTQKHGVYLYWDIHVMKSPDGGANWQTLVGTALVPPIVADDAGPADRVSLEDEFEVHTWLSSMLAKDGKLHFLYLAQTEEPRQHYVRYDLATGQRERDIYPRVGGKNLWMCRLDGFFAADLERPASPLYCFASTPIHSRQVACIVSRDNGDTWHDYGLSTEQFGCLYALGGCPAVTSDGHIIGSFTDTSAGGNAMTGVGVHFFRVSVAPP
ncbi:MAG: BNR repeat-containing protein [Pirellulaceae bacterium]|nr:BNR repeat-containing protein [Pirellulaceae bacterium]